MGKVKTVKTVNLGRKELRLVHLDGRFFGLIDGIRCDIEGEDADDVWRRLHDEVGKRDPRYFGFSGARKRFSIFFPNGFHHTSYTSREREYKLKAKERLDREVPLEAALHGTGYGEAVLRVFGATNLISPYEKMRLQDLLRGPRADTFVQAAARFTLEASQANLSAMEQVLKPDNNAKWTVVTYLPFLWEPDKHMFLKPVITKDFATRVGHRFSGDYEAGLKISIYESLLDLVAKTERELADMHPLDRIDIQSFIWVVGDYKDPEDRSRFVLHPDEIMISD